MAGTDEGRLVEAARAGDQRAFGQLFDLWFDRVHDLSRRIVRDTEVAAEVAQDAFLKAWTRLDTLDDVDAFGGWLLRIARNASLNRLDKERRSVALDDETMTTLTDLDPDDTDPLARLDQAAQVSLVWEAAQALGPRDLSVLDLHLRHGLGAAELAEELGTNRNNAHQILHTLRERLGTNVRALVLWRAGHPSCPDLRTSLASGGTGHFDKKTVKVIDRHAAACDDCGRERSARLSPAALFGAAPVVAAPILLRSQAAAGLEAAGVPMAGSTALTGGAPGAGAPGSGGAGADDPGVPGGAEGSGGPGGPGDPGGLGGPVDGDGPDESARRRRVLLVLAVLLVLFGGTVAWLVAAGADGSDDDVVEQVPGSTTTTGPADGAPTVTVAPTVATTTDDGATTTTAGDGRSGEPVPTDPRLTDPTVPDPDEPGDPVDPVDPTTTTTPTRVPPRRPGTTTTTTTTRPRPPITPPTWVIVLPPTTTLPTPG